VKLLPQQIAARIPGEQGTTALLEFPLDHLYLSSLALGSNYYYLNKIIAKMLHLSTETYNNE